MIGLEPLVDVLLLMLPLSSRDVALPLYLYLLSGEGDRLLDRHGRSLSRVVIDSL